MKQRLWYVLYKLAELGGTQRTIRASTIEMSEILGVSQQTASRHLAELKEIGYITEQTSVNGIEVKLTEKGIDELRSIYLQLKAIIEGPANIITIEGTVFSGLGEGAYYVSQREYSRQFKRKIGFIPYPGTLNLKLLSLEIVKKKELETYPPILIRGFEKHNRQFGDARCYLTRINNESEGAAIMINRTHYDDSVIELIAPLHLKSTLTLKEGDRAILTFFPSKIKVLTK
jgi:riboflavin kinase